MLDDDEVGNSSFLSGDLGFAGASASACSGVAGRCLLLGFGGALVGFTLVLVDLEEVEDC